MEDDTNKRYISMVSIPAKEEQADENADEKVHTNAPNKCLLSEQEHDTI